MNILEVFGKPRDGDEGRKGREGSYDTCDAQPLLKMASCNNYTGTLPIAWATCQGQCPMGHGPRPTAQDIRPIAVSNYIALTDIINVMVIKDYLMA